MKRIATHTNLNFMYLSHGCLVIIESMKVRKKDYFFIVSRYVQLFREDRVNSVARTIFRSFLLWLIKEEFISIIY